MERPRGAMTALITHLNDDGSIDYKNFERHVEFQIGNGINGIVPCGTTGQSPTLSWEEHNKINYAAISVRKRLGSSVPVIVGAGSNNAAEGIEATKKAADQGADATLHVTGYYNMPAQAGFADYFLRVADAAPGGVIIYNIPGRGHPIIQADVMAALAKARSNIWGTKDSTGGKANSDGDKFWREVRREARGRGIADNKFLLLSGDDTVTYYMMTTPEIAGSGVISVWSNIFPGIYSDMTARIARGDYAGARGTDDTLKELNGIVGVRASYPLKIGDEELLIRDDNFRNPQAVQFAASLLGMGRMVLRSPMVAPPQEARQRVGAALYRLHEKRPDYFEPITRHFKPMPGIAERLAPYGRRA